MRNAFLVVSAFVAIALFSMSAMSVFAQATEKNGGISLVEFVELLIALEIVAPEKVAAARDAVKNAQEKELSSTPASLPPPLSTEPVPPLFLARNLSIGSEGEDVRRLQRFLARDANIYPEGLVTGYYGVLTERAVRRFQEKEGIVAGGTPETAGVGVVGPRTRSALQHLAQTGEETGEERAPTKREKEGGGVQDAVSAIETPTCSLSATPLRAVVGESVTLSWETRNTQVVTITDVGSVANSGFFSFLPLESKTYTLTAEGLENDAVCAITVTVAEKKINENLSCSLSAEPSTITRGTVTTLSWSSSQAAESAEISGLGSVSSRGSRTVAPLQSQVYRLTVESADRASQSCSTLVTVKDPNQNASGKSFDSDIIGETKAEEKGVGAKSITDEGQLIIIPLFIHLIQSPHETVRAKSSADDMRRIVGVINSRYWKQAKIVWNVQKIKSHTVENGADSILRNSLRAGDEGETKNALLKIAEGAVFPESSFNVFVLHDFSSIDGNGFYFAPSGMMFVSETSGESSGDDYVAFLIAHELGHALTLAHNEDQENFMVIGGKSNFARRNRTKLTDVQINRARSQALRGIPGSPPQ